MTGIVFDIKEFAVYDGPGIRTTVFLKGCPLRCAWCHNPEGLDPRPQLMTSPSACKHCGACAAVCPSPERCTACGRCVSACRGGLRRIVGDAWEASDLAARILRDRAILEGAGGGATFSGGEPLMQWDFVREVVENLDGLHTCIETSGYCSDAVFADMMSRIDLVMMDIKLVDPLEHKRWTGVDNEPILRHARMLADGDTPFIIRLPLIPGVNDFESHIAAVAELLKDAKALQRVELLPYHKTAGAKYAMVGLDYAVDFDPDRDVKIFTAPLDAAGIEWVRL